MARWTRRLRRGAAVGAALVLLCAAGAWIASASRFDDLSYRWGRWRQVPPPSGSILEWSYEADSAGVANANGKMTFHIERYTSFAPALEQLASWESWPEWKHTHMASTAARPEDVPGTYFEAFDDFSLLRLRLSHSSRQGTDARFLQVPHWILVAAAGAAAVLLVRPDARRWRRRRRGRCETCGYDRQGLVAGTPCPECNAAGTR